MRASLTRRMVLAGAGGSLAALVCASAARAAPGGMTNPVQRLIGGLPREVQSLLPQEVFEAGDFISALLALEGEARTLRLPKSPLSLTETAIPADLDRLYELALPRVVALIDRSEFRHRPFAEKAGGLLARLHGTQHVAPMGIGRALSFDMGEDPAIDLTPAELAIPTPELFPADEPLVVTWSLRFADLESEYATMFERAEIVTAHSVSTGWHLEMMRRARPRYEVLGRRAGVPWHFIAAIHGLEASFNFRSHLHNGDFPLSQRTRQVPAGRPAVWLPPSDWESSALDALRFMGFSGQPDWSLPRTLYRLEAYNGFGYRRMGKVSPYLWSFSSLYAGGKFVADGHYDARARSQQCGGAVMLKLLAQAGEISFA